MNKIYALKYSISRGHLVVVSEICRRKQGKSVRRRLSFGQLSAALLALPLSLCLPEDARASRVNGDFDYQLYRDFAENKGEFTPGTQDIKLYKRANNSGKPDLTITVPMADFSSIDAMGVSTLIAPSYITSVSHNVSIHQATYGKTTYKVISNNIEVPKTPKYPDVKIPRLNKFVVDVAPAKLLPFNMYKEGSKISDRTRFPIAMRAGSGTQQVRINGKDIYVDGAYKFLTGGVVDSVWYNPLYLPRADYNNRSWLTSGYNKIASKTLDTYPLPGDSGSPLFIWDNETKQWEVVGVLHSLTFDAISNWSHINPDFLAKLMREDTDPLVDLNDADAQWGANAITANGKTWAWHGIDNNNNALDKTKHLQFTGGGTVTLTQNINQGAGGLFFDGDKTYTFQGNQYSWQGAGLDIAKGTTVNWQLKGVVGDFLHKIGEGILKVAGIGVNPGGIKVGDGTVVLAQQPDKDGKVQAFSSLVLVSGRPTVVLSDNKQINTDNISWQKRGGTLDVNGNDITFHKPKAMDNGAVITNSNEKMAKLTINTATDNSVRIYTWDENKANGGRAGKPGYLYRSDSGDAFYIQKKDNYDHQWFPVRSSNDYWEYVGDDEEKAKEMVRERRKPDNYVFHGNITGNLNILTDTAKSTGAMIFDGNINTPNGTLQQNSGSLVFQGHPVIHAYTAGWIAAGLRGHGDNSVKTQAVSYDQPDWESRHFHLQQLKLENTDAHIARNATVTAAVSLVNGSISVGDPQVYIDKFDGNNVYQSPRLPNDQQYAPGNSIPQALTDKGTLLGDIDAKRAAVNVSGIWQGAINGSDSTLTVSGRATLTGSSQLHNTPVTVSTGGQLTASGGWQSDDALTVNDGGMLVLNNASGKDSPQAAPPAIYRLSSLILQGSARAQVTGNSQLLGNIHADKNANILIGDAITDPAPAGNAEALPASDAALPSVAQGSGDSYYRGTINAPQAQMSLHNAHWDLTGNSTISRLDALQSVVMFNAPSSSSPGTPAGSATDWQPHTLTVDQLTATNVHFHLTARPQTGQADSIIVRRRTDGNHNALDVHTLINDQAPVTAADVLLASAPLVTPDSFFSVSPVHDGLRLYVANARITTVNDQKQWSLRYAVPSQPEDAQSQPEVVQSQPEITPSQPEITPSQPEVAPTASLIPSAKEMGSLFTQLFLKLTDINFTSGTADVPALLARRGINATAAEIQQYQQLVQETVHMLKRVKNLGSVPQISFVLETNQLDKRLGDVRQLAEPDGFWLKASGGRANYQSLALRHTTLQLGVDKKAGNHLYGIMGSYTAGNSSGLDLQERHTTGGVGLYYAYIPDNGLFIDVVGKYLRNHYHYQFPGTSTLGSHSPRGTSLLASVQAGYHARFFDGKLFVEPGVEVLTGRTTGYTMRGRDISLQIRDSNPVYSKIGIAAGVNWQRDPQHNVILSAGVFRLQNLKKNGDMLLSDASGSAIRLPAGEDNRYLADLSFSTRLSANWRVYARGETSFGGKLKNDYSGQIGVRYQF